MMENEIWKDVQGFEGRYQVSNMGRVRSLDRLIEKPHPYIRKGEILNPSMNGKKGYLRISLSDGHRNYTHYEVHRLVALHFVPGYKKGLVVNHKNEIKTDNRSENLEWCTYQYNLNYSDVVAWKRKPVYQYDMDGNFIAKHKCCSEVEKTMGTRPGAMVYVMYGSKRGVWKGYRWSFEQRSKEYWMQHDKKGSAKRKKVVQLDASGNIIKSYNSMTEASKATGIHVGTISSSCRRESTIQKLGYLWRYAEK